MSEEKEEGGEEGQIAKIIVGISVVALMCAGLLLLWHILICLYGIWGG